MFQALLSAGLLWVSCLAGLGQTLTLTNGVYAVSGLTNTTVTLSGKCLLRVTGAANPLPGSILHFNSADAWLLLPNIAPSEVAASLVSQFRVNGAAAVTDSNLRVVQYASGSMVLPHSGSYAPLQVFTGTHFLGNAANLALYTYYTNTTLGSFNRNIRSFRLKHGYSVTLAQEPDGTGESRVFVAQEGDLEVSVLPAEFGDRISFVRVFPWRWTSKKGWAGAVQPLVNPHWSYDWNNVATSTLDTEYVPMRHNRWWNSYDNLNVKQKSTHALGFNEPDKADQADMTVAAAIEQWPNLMKSGLRLGSPAPSDAASGLTWLYDFIDQADALNYRVDYVAVHFYKGGWTASQYYDWLLAIYQRTGRPIWITEFNNGATWTCCEPTLSSQATVIGQFIDMLDNAPFVERYAIYNWVGTNREMVTSSGTLTPAGVVYRDNASPLAYLQTVPGASRHLAMLRFETNTLDTSGYGNNAMGVGLPSYGGGRVGQALRFDGTNQYVLLPGNIASSSSFTFAGWVYWEGGGNWQRIFDFGDDTSKYMFLTPKNGTYLRFAIKNGGAEQTLSAAPLASNQWVHVAVTLGGSNARMYTNGVLAASATNFSILPSQFTPTRNFLGESQFTADPLFRGMMDEVLITDYVLTAAQIASLFTNTPPQFTTNSLTKPAVPAGRPYQGETLAGSATDPNAGQTLTFGKASGPAWLTVASNGALSGQPGPGDAGTNRFVVRVIDSAGACSFAELSIVVNGFLNHSFENPEVATYSSSPPGASWLFSLAASSGAGISANASAFTSGSAPAPDGLQVAYIQNTSTVSQVVGGFIPTTNYTLSFKAVQRQNKSGGQAGQVIHLKVDGALVGVFVPPQPDTNYQQYATNFLATKTSHTIAFTGASPGGADNTVFLDDVRLQAAPPPAAPLAPTALTAAASPGQVRLGWQPSPLTLHYTVKRKPEGGSTFATVAPQLTATNYVDAEVLNGKEYTYVVSATNPGGESPDSQPASARPVATNAVSVTASLDQGTFGLSWPSDHTGWRLEMQIGGLSGPWINVGTVSATNRIFIPATNDSAFFRLVYP